MGTTSRVIPGHGVMNGNAGGSVADLLDRECFSRVVSRERKRAERSGASMLLLVIDFGDLAEEAGIGALTAVMTEAFQGAIRDTDACGWIEPVEQAGLLFTGIAGDVLDQARQRIVMKVRKCLFENLVPASYRKVGLTIHTFPEEPSGLQDGNRFDSLFYPELGRNDAPTRLNRLLKRSMDIMGSLAALALLSPLFLLIAVLIRCTSPGPVIFRQERLGQFGRPFSFLKFRTMYVGNNDAIHREFIRNFIANRSGDGDGSENGDVIFKIRRDPRVTRIGAFLRKSSLDELPQFINVLRGDMSLVGPRPPIAYEVEDYAPWHRYRIIARKPGITGLWQVTGRSLTAFDGMVRLDLRYIRSWSLWLDVKLLLATPLAVFRGKGAY